MAREIYISLKDGKKESELTLKELDAQHQLALIDGVFKFFEVDVDFEEMAAIYRRSGKAYKEFFNQLDTTLDYSEETKNMPVTAEAYESALIEVTQELEQPKAEEPQVKVVVPIIEVKKKPTPEPVSMIAGYHHTYDPLNSDFYLTGIKYDSTGKPQYKCRYKCPNCGDESNHYIKTDTKHVRCWKCQRMLKVKPATTHGEPVKTEDPELFRDQYGNFFVAGAFEVDVKTLADAEHEEELE